MRQAKRRFAVMLAMAGAFFLWKGGSTVYFWTRPAVVEPTISLSAAPALPAALPEGAVVARMRIPRLGLDEAIVAGTSEAALLRGPGHLRNTPMPGDRGNSVLAGHRDTHFRALRKIKVGDVIIVERNSHATSFLVTGTQIVEPQDLSVLQPRAGATLTLITCYPFSFIGPAPQRFVVMAEVTSTAAS